MGMSLTELLFLVERNKTLARRNPHLGSSISGAQPQPSVPHRTLGKIEGKEKSPGRFRVRIICHRHRLIDPDNAVPKYLVDCLRYAGAIPDDSARFVELTVTQTKTQGPEVTILEVTPIP